jgi:hypothetical protein
MIRQLVALPTRAGPVGPLPRQPIPNRVVDWDDAWCSAFGDDQ